MRRTLLSRGVAVTGTGDRTRFTPMSRNADANGETIQVASRVMVVESRNPHLERHGIVEEMQGSDVRLSLEGGGQTVIPAHLVLVDEPEEEGR